MPYLFSVWCGLAVAVLTLAGYRKWIANREDDTVHLADGNSRLVAEQMSVAARLSGVDRWGKVLTVVTLVFGLVIGTIYLYQGWIESAQKVHI